MAAMSLYSLAPDHGLQPLDSESWVVEETAYASFPKAVIATLYLLGEI
jgi:hypothetical protein